MRLREWCDGADDAAINALIAEIADHAGPGRGRGSVIPYVSFQLPKLTWLRGGLAALGGVAVAFALTLGLSGRSSADKPDTALALRASSLLQASAEPSDEKAYKSADKSSDQPGYGKMRFRGLLSDAGPALSRNAPTTFDVDPEQAAWMNILDHRANADRGA